MFLEFTTERKTREKSVRLWDGSQLVDVCIIRCRRDLPLFKNQLGMVSKLLGAVSEELVIVSSGVLV